MTQPAPRRATEVKPSKGTKPTRPTRGTGAKPEKHLKDRGDKKFAGHSSKQGHGGKRK